MEHISFHDICIIMDALKLYTKTMKEAESIIPTGAAGELYRENIEHSIRLKEFFSKVGDQLAVIDENLSVNIVAKFHEA